MWSYNDAIEDDPYDPEAAKKMLAEAGVTDLSMKVWAMPVARPYNPNARRVAELIQADFAKIGVNVEIVTYEWARVSASAPRPRTATAPSCSAGPATTAIRTTSSTPCSAATPSAATTAPSGATRSSTSSSQEAKVATDQAERTKLYEEAQVVFKREAPWATIAHSLVLHADAQEGRGLRA